MFAHDKKALSVSTSDISGSASSHDTDDVKSLVFADTTLTYNGTAQHMTITGKLPVGADGIQVTVEYTGSATNVADGPQMITAIFSTSSDNYNVPAPMQAQLTIARAKPLITMVDTDGACGETYRIFLAAVTLLNGESYNGYISYSYFADKECTKAITSKVMKDVGVYYVKGSIEAFGNYDAAESNVAKVTVNHYIREVAASEGVAKHWDCVGCHRHFLDVEGKVEYFISDSGNGSIFNGNAVMDIEDSSKAVADAESIIATMGVVSSEDPSMRIVAELKTMSDTVTTISVDAAQVRSLADRGANVKVSNTAVAAEFSASSLKLMGLSSGDFTLEAKRVAVPERYSERLGDDAVVVDINLNVAGNAVKEFGDKVKVTIRYTLPEGSSAKDLRIYYLGDELEAFDCEYDAESETITFETTHFSEFAVGFDVSSGKQSNTLMIVLLIAFIIPVFTVLMYFSRKKM